MTPNLSRRLSKKFGKKAIQNMAKKAFKTILKQTGKKVGTKAAVAAAKQGAVVGAKTAGTAAKTGVKAGMGPVGWVLLAVDLVSTVLDILDVGGYNEVLSTELFLTERETARKDHESYLKEERDKQIKEGIQNPQINYPRIVGPLDKISTKEFQEELEKYEEKIINEKTKEFFIEYINNMSQSDFDKLVDTYLNSLHSENNPSLNYFTTNVGKSWKNINEEARFYYKKLGWNKDKFNSNSKPKSYRKKWSELSLDERNSALILGYTCSIWNKKECTENPFKNMTEDDLLENLFTDEYNSPIFTEDSEFNVISTYMNDKLGKYLESDRHYNIFLKDLCGKYNGKWIVGSSFGKTLTYFHTGSKCSYKTREECDSSYDWNYFKKEVDGPKVKISEKYTKFANLIDLGNKEIETLKQKLNEKNTKY